MKKITFKVSSSKESSIVSLIKDVNKISCRIFIDFENGFVAVENVNDYMIEEVIELINIYYTILSIDIDNTFDQTVEKSTISSATETVKEIETANEIEKHKVLVQKVGDMEFALLEEIGFAFDELDPYKDVEEQVKPFLENIEMTTTEKLVTESFIIACDIKRINYENIILRLHETFPGMDEDTIKSILKEEFKNWLTKYPTLAERCPKISIMAVLKLFVKKLKSAN